MIWWLRTPNTNNDTNAWNVNTNGNSNNNNVTNEYGVVPAIGENLRADRVDFIESRPTSSRNYYPDLPRKREVGELERRCTFLIFGESGAINFGILFMKTVEEIFTYERLYESLCECRRGQMWKGSVIDYSANYVENLLELEELLHNDEYQARPDNITFINERGKVRKIHSQHIRDRIVHKIINQDILIPTFHGQFIRQNTASQTGKGMDFAMRTMKCHLNRAYRKWGKDFYVLSIDMKSYFESIPHWYLEKLLRKKIDDDRIVKLCMEPFRAYEGGKGLGLGSEMNQTYALLCLDEFDHIIKEQFHVKEYARYMDDMYILHNDKSFLMDVLKYAEGYFADIDLSMNAKKTNIFPIKNGITFLGFRWKLTDSGHVSVIPKKQTIIRNKKKLRKLKKKFVQGEFTLPEIANSYASMRGHINRGNCDVVVDGMDNYFYNLFGGKRNGR